MKKAKIDFTVFVLAITHFHVQKVSMRQTKTSCSHHDKREGGRIQGTLQFQASCCSVYLQLDKIVKLKQGDSFQKFRAKRETNFKQRIFL